VLTCTVYIRVISRSACVVLIKEDDYSVGLKYAVRCWLFTTRSNYFVPSQPIN